MVSQYLTDGFFTDLFQHVVKVRAVGVRTDVNIVG